jgi:hypothetical protein
MMVWRIDKSVSLRHIDAETSQHTGVKNATPLDTQHAVSKGRYDIQSDVLDSNIVESEDERQNDRRRRRESLLYALPAELLDSNGGADIFTSHSEFGQY